MAQPEELGEVISTDILIIGGGIGGLVAAIKAKEEAPDADVLLVDKQTIGWSGKAPKTGGVLYLIGPDDDLDKFVEYNVKNIGDYLNDQDLLYDMAKETYGAVEKLANWGVNVTKNEEGKFATFQWPGAKWSLIGVDLNMLKPLRRQARKAGAKMLDKTQVVDLLKNGDRVVGAVGFNIIDGRYAIFKAKSTILANGSCDYKVERMWASANGDGIAAAYRAGAEMRNAEFGNFYDILSVDENNPAVGSQDRIYNAQGESIVEKYGVKNEPDIALATLLGMEKEITEGRGPLYLHTGKTAMPPRQTRQTTRISAMPHRDAFWGRGREKVKKYGPPRKDKMEVTFAFHGELSPIKVDHDMKTTLEGLWAIGDTSYAGSAFAGAVFAPPARMRGSGLMNAVLSALRGGKASAAFSSGSEQKDIDTDEVRHLKAEIFAPMNRDNGFTPAEVVKDVQKLVVPVKYNLRRSKDRMEEALVQLEALKQKLPKLYAKDYHGLFQCHEARAMAICAEMTFRSALMREESRGWHYREDYPQRDDKNWLKWVIVKQEEGKMALSTEPVPIEKYKIKP